MDAQWVASSAGLPNEGQPVEFMLEDREIAMDGTYVQQTFRSRWTDYGVERVRTWRSAGVASFADDTCAIDMAPGGAQCAA
jgi:hypothetical protein